MIRCEDACAKVDITTVVKVSYILRSTTDIKFLLSYNIMSVFGMIPLFVLINNTPTSHAYLQMDSNF